MNRAALAAFVACFLLSFSAWAQDPDGISQPGQPTFGADSDSDGDEEEETNPDRQKMGAGMGSKVADGFGEMFGKPAKPKPKPIPIEVLAAADNARHDATKTALVAADAAADDGTRAPRGYLWPYDGAFQENPMQAEGKPLGEEDERQTPNLSKREEEPTTAGDVLIWIPRVLLFPVYLVTEYLIRWPLGVITKAVEKYKIPEYVIEYTTWDNGNGRVLPTFRIVSDFAPAIGLGAIWENMFLPNNDWALAFDFNTGDNLTIDALTQVRMLDDDLILRLGYQIEVRNDFIFHGVGPDTEQSDETRFFRDKRMAYVGSSYDPTNGGFGGKFRFEASEFDFDCSEHEERSICGPDNRIGTSDDLLSVDAESPYFTAGYDIIRAKASLFYDTRAERPKRGSGVRLEATGRYGRGIGEHEERIEFYRAGGELTLFWDVFNQRVLIAQVYAEIAEPVGGRDIPFSELIVLGGVEHLRGFSLGRFHGRSAAVGALGYRYPVWSFLDGFLVFEAGNVFDPQFEGFDFGKMHGSAALGFSTNSTRYQSFDILLALGTSKFEQSLEVDSFRVAIGTNWGQ